jgi:hypothetical protein
MESWSCMRFFHILSASSSACGRHQETHPFHSIDNLQFHTAACLSLSLSDTSTPSSNPPPSQRTHDNQPTYLLPSPLDMPRKRNRGSVDPSLTQPHWTLTQCPVPSAQLGPIPHTHARTCKPRLPHARGAVRSRGRAALRWSVAR